MAKSDKPTPFRDLITRKSDPRSTAVGDSRDISREIEKEQRRTANPSRRTSTLSSSASRPNCANLMMGADCNVLA
jgi:hypothetical protein